MGLGIFGQQASLPTGFDNGLGFQNYLLQSTGGAAPDVSQSLVNQALMADWGQLGALGKIGAITGGLDAFSSLAGLYSGFRNLRLQEKSFDFQRDMANKNYANQVKDYENTLKDRWAARRASAGARGAGYESMGSWVGSRALTGTTPASHSGG